MLPLARTDRGRPGRRPSPPGSAPPASRRSCHRSWGPAAGQRRVCLVGHPDQGRKLLPALRDATPPPVAERVQELTYLELQTMDDEAHRHGLLRRYWKGHYLRDLDDGAIQAFLSRGDGRRRRPDAAALRQPPELRRRDRRRRRCETAFGHRDALVEFVAVADWTDPAQDEARMAAARRYGAAVEPFASGVYVNDLTDEGQAASGAPTARARWPGWPR